MAPIDPPRDLEAATRPEPRRMTAEMEQQLMERHRVALQMADAAGRRPMALLALCEAALQVAAMGGAVAAATAQGQQHPLAIFLERPAKIITHKNGGVERVLVAMRLDGQYIGELSAAVAALQADADAAPADGQLEADPASPIPGVTEEATAPAAPAPELERARVQPCGCQVCVCEDPDQCQGCGARNCGRPRVECNLSGIGPDPIYNQEQLQADEPDRPRLHLVE